MTDIVTYCDVNTCEDCPRYGDDCDGDKRVEHTDIISRADAIEAWDKLSKRGRTEFDQVLMTLPSADAVQGEWEKTTDGNGWNEWHVLKCPLCDATIEDKQNRKWEYNYCPNCGARMTPYKGGDEE